MIFDNKGEIIARALLYQRLAHPDYSISELYQAVHDTTGSPIASIRRVKSTLLKRLKMHVQILEEK